MIPMFVVGTENGEGLLPSTFMGKGDSVVENQDPFLKNETAASGEPGFGACEGLSYVSVLEVLQGADRYWPNHFSQWEKLSVLNVLELRIYEEILKTHIPAPGPYVPYTEENSVGRVILVPEPFGKELYLWWIRGQIASLQEEAAHYNGAAERFNLAYRDFARWYHRKHKSPRGSYRYW